ncbi:hypothetical protein TELCIR_15559 [Teladorsagia circumcincta]|uniref:ShKT domain-containing protein n=1 Tax=Teladorsagia circumcincta TaxID=45464 RepID=A0A2G9TY47_TELCI|nr:hypothetical protein TELCIR_15559 [Teladorsagia circumcincta]
MDPTFGDVMARHCTLTCKRCDDVEFEDEYGVHSTFYETFHQSSAEKRNTKVQVQKASQISAASPA